MASPCTGSPRRTRLGGRRAAAWAALGLGWLLPSVGCQVEYAGMTLPSGKYMYDDVQYFPPGPEFPWAGGEVLQDRKSTRLNSSHPSISYAVFCLKKKKRSTPQLSTSH